MARALWKGSISFGLVTIPVQLHSAIDRKTISFHMLDKSGTCRLRQKLYCPETKKEYDFADTARGVEIAPDQYVIVQEEELEKLKPEGGRSIDILDVVDLEEIDPIYFDRTYFLSPDEGGEKGFRLLMDAMNETKRAGIARFIMRGNEYLGTLRVMGKDVLVLTTMYFAEDIRSSEEYRAPEVKVDKRELALAKQLMDALYAGFDPDKYKNEYRERVEKFVAEKKRGKKVILADTGEQPRGKVLDLMEALKQSVRTKGSGEGRRDNQRAAKQARSKKSGTKPKAGGKKRSKNAA